MNNGCFRAAVAYGHLGKEVFGRRFGVFDEHVKVAVIIENACVNEFVFHFATASRPVGFDQIIVGIGALRVFIKIFHVRVGRRAVIEKASLTSSP